MRPSEATTAGTRHVWVAYAVAAAAVAVAATARLLLDPILQDRQPYVLFYGAVILLTKPVDPEVILQLLASVCALSDPPSAGTLLQ